MKKKLIIYLSLLLCAFLCTTKVYAGDMSGLEGLSVFADWFLITVYALPIYLIMYSIFWRSYFSKKKKKQTKEVKKSVEKIKYLLYFLTIPLIIYLVYTVYVFTY